MDQDEKENATKPSVRVPFGVYVKAFFLMTVVASGVYAAHTFSTGFKKKDTAFSSKTLSGLIKFASTASAEVAKKKTQMMKNGVQSTSKQVLGDATKYTDSAVATATEQVTGYVYEHTLEQVILKLIANLPESERNKFKTRYCQEKE